MNYWFACIVLFAVLASAHGLSCPECNKTACVDPTDCKGSLTLDVCACCNECAKVEGEACAGPFGISGQCDEGLVCYIQQPSDFNSEGICSKIECPKNCPTVSANPTMKEAIGTWICLLEDHRCSTFEWKNTFEKWWRGNCNDLPSEFYREWFTLSECPRHEKIKCKNSDRISCESDAYGCEICKCDKGRYENPLKLLEIWQLHLEKHKLRMKLYKEASDACLNQ